MKCDERALTESVILERTQPWTSGSRMRMTSKARTLMDDNFVPKTPWQHRPLYHQTNCQPTLGPHRIEAVPWHHSSVGLKILAFVAILILPGFLIRMNNVRENIGHSTLLHAQWMFIHQQYVRMDRPVQVSEPNHHFHHCPVQTQLSNVVKTILLTMSSIGNVRTPVYVRCRPRSIACCLCKSWVSWSAPSCWYWRSGCWCTWSCLRSLRLPSSLPQGRACTVRCSSHSFSFHRPPRCEVLPLLYCVSHASHQSDSTSSV